MAATDVLQGKPWYWGFLIGLVILGTAVALTHYLLVVDINKQIKENEAKLDELAKKIAAGRAAEKKLPQFREEVKRLELEFEKLKRILPSNRNTEEIIKKIKTLVDQGNFTLLRLVFPPLGKPSAQADVVYAEWPITVNIEGGYHDLALLFNRLSNFSRIVNVEQFSIVGLTRQLDRTIGCTFVAKTFVYSEPTPEELAAAQAKKKKGKPGKKKGKK